MRKMAAEQGTGLGKAAGHPDWMTSMVASPRLKGWASAGSMLLRGDHEHGLVRAGPEYGDRHSGAGQLQVA